MVVRVMKLASVTGFLREVIEEWSKDNALTLGAALAYYTVFSMAPLLVLVIAIAGLAFGRADAQGQIVAQVQGTLGASGAELIESMIERASEPKSGVIATVISLATMLFGASGVFGQLQGSLNQIWGAHTPRRKGVLGQLQRRAMSFSMILVIGFLLFVSLALTALLAGLHDAIDAYLTVPNELLSLANFSLSFAIVTALFAMIFKILPDARIEWRDVWLGAAVTALLFTVGKSLIGIYLGRAGVTSVYGAAGSLVLVLLWVYYSSQLLFLGAEFTEVYSRRYGSRQQQVGS
jgi:membrane protein